MLDRREFRTAQDKAGWSNGPWQSEPDVVQWIDSFTGYYCMAHRNHGGSWCGYVGIPEGHVLYGIPYDDCYSLDCHGGLTFTGELDTQNELTPGFLSYVRVKETDPEKLWFLGFDCGHYMDFSPGYAAILNLPPREQEVYRNLEYVQMEVVFLAQQIYDADNTGPAVESIKKEIGL